MDDVRILAKGRITDLSKGFKIGVPFSVYLRSKSGVVENDTLVRCRLICDQKIGDFPVPIGDWTPGKIVELPPNAIDTDKYEIFWGASEAPHLEYYK